MGLVELKVFPRSTGGKNANRRTRAAGYTPAVIYGYERQAQAVQLDSKELVLVLQRLAGHSAIFSLREEGAQAPAIALLREVQRHPVRDEILHVDLFEIPRGEPVEVPVSIRLVGESQAVKRNEGNLSQSLTQVEIRCLPGELPETIDVDISELGVNDKVYVGDLTSPVGEIVSDRELLVVAVKAPAIFAATEAEGEEDAAAAEGAETAEDETESGE
ncbi:MAG: 50S ribosomal protein L25 [Candidatus Krumholzibacteriia bacterium]